MSIKRILRRDTLLLKTSKRKGFNKLINLELLAGL